MTHTWHQGDFEISTDPARLQLDAIAAALAESYWAAGRSRATIERSLANSLCFGLYFQESQIGLARVITDRATFAYLCDVYVLDAHRGHGLGKWLVATVMGHPDLLGLRRWSLATRNAHGLYHKFGFQALKTPENWLEVFNPTPGPA